MSTVRSRRFISFSHSTLTDHVLCVFAEYFSNKSLCRQRNIMEKDSQHTRTAGSDGQMAMGYNFYFCNFIIMTSCCHMWTQIQMPNSKAYIIFYPPISCLQNSFFNKIKKNILQIPKSYFRWIEHDVNFGIWYLDLSWHVARGHHNNRIKKMKIICHCHLLCSGHSQI